MQQVSRVESFLHRSYYIKIGRTIRQKTYQYTNKDENYLFVNMTVIIHVVSLKSRQGLMLTVTVYSLD